MEVQEKGYTGPLADIHSHFMPCMDEGPADMETAIQMLRMAEKQGVTDLFVTSHGDFVCDRVRYYHKMYRRLLKEAEKNHIGIRIYEGCEIFGAWSAESDAAKVDRWTRAVRAGRYPSLNGTDYILLEFDIAVEPPEALFMVKRLQREGLKVVLAHAERYFSLIEEHFVETLVKEGCFVQMNAGSPVNRDRELFCQNARYLLQHRLVHFLGSDAHGVIRRPPDMQGGVQYILEHCDRAYALDVLYRNAYCYLIQKRLPL